VSVSYPRGFRAAGIAAGLKPSGRPDLGLLVADPGATAAGLFTTNVVAAAPVVLGRERLAAGAPTAVLVNSGQANAATGERGLADAASAARAAAGHLGLDPEGVLPCSTGVIGEPVHMAELLAALPSLVASLDASGGPAFANAIRTTDTVDKQAVADAAGDVRVGGCAKGVGMISPNLATMLAFVTTDAPVSAGDLQTAASTVLAPVFNAITVDGCTSTNDTVLLFASGAAGSERVPPGSPAWNAWVHAIETVAASLASQLIHDGEGVTHVMLVDVTGAADEVDARRLANAVADSPLVKTALFGADPNPGRILQALGAAGAPLDASRVDVWVGDTRLVHAGVIPPAYFATDELRTAAAAAMTEPEVGVRIVVGDGPGTARVLGGDLSYDYVRINGEYTT
jgi:glutamate N-acetyltransferase / amino-acid N-acetyltransferase